MADARGSIGSDRTVPLVELGDGVLRELDLGRELLDDVLVLGGLRLERGRALAHLLPLAALVLEHRLEPPDLILEARPLSDALLNRVLHLIPVDSECHAA